MRFVWSTHSSHLISSHLISSHLISLISHGDLPIADGRGGVVVVVVVRFIYTYNGMLLCYKKRLLKILFWCIVRNESIIFHILCMHSLSLSSPTRHDNTKHSKFSVSIYIIHFMPCLQRSGDMIDKEIHFDFDFDFDWHDMSPTPNQKPTPYSILCVNLFFLE
jgi:hypothetical protein